MYVMAALLVIGFICNACIRAVNERYYMKSDQLERTVPAFGGE
jgi:hypothetical protein